MTIRFDRPVSRAARLSRHCGALSLVVLLGAVVAHRFGGLQTPYLVLLVMVAAGLALLAAVLAALGLHSLWDKGAEGGLNALRGLVYASLPLAISAFAAERYLAYPALYEVTTDISSPPDWLNPVHADQIWLPRPAVTPEDRDRQAEAYPQLTGRRYEGAIDRVLQGVKKVARQTGLRLTTAKGDPDFSAPALADPQPIPSAPPADQRAVPDAPDAPGAIPVPLPRPFDDDVAKLIRRADGVTLQGSERSLVLGLTFDVVIRLREEAETTFVDISVASRYGPHDLGFSAEVAQDFLTALDAELLGIAGG